MKTAIRNGRRPFWLLATNYYVLAFAVSTTFFFLIWGLLQEEGEEMPWATAGVSASIILISSVVFRQMILRRTGRHLAIRQRPQELPVPYVLNPDPRNPDKLTLERNAAILTEIQRKSDAANVLGRLAAGHREVFELCSEYMARNEAELASINPNSPRLPALLRGRTAAGEFHRFHLLKWAQIEVHALTDEALSQDDAEDKRKSAKAALSVIDTAMRSYPAEESLIDSQELLLEMVVSINVSEWIQRAERAAFDGEYSKAGEFYREALFILGRDNVQNELREAAARKIQGQLDVLRSTEI
jgi:hypothetical protein